MTPAAWSTYRRGACLPGTLQYWCRAVVTWYVIERRLAGLKGAAR